MIELKHGNSKLILQPWRGGSISHWNINNREILYCDQKSYQEKNIKYKGGIPVMFPIFSTTCLNGDNKIRYDGKQIDLQQHGFARLSNLWRCNQVADNQINMYLQANTETLASFPFKFEFEQQLTIIENTLNITQKVFNPSKETLPFVSGIHPYFSISDPSNCEINGIPYGSPYYLQLNSGERDFNAKLNQSLPLGKSEINHHFKSSPSKVTLKDRKTGHQITLEKSPEYPCITVWSELNQPFICIEPNTGRRGAFETRENLIRLKPGESWSGKIKITAS
jgi:galactose mutarotase-like enzyme